MPIVASCSCGESFAAPPSLAGKKARCPSCGETITIPHEDVTDASEASKPQTSSPNSSRSAQASRPTPGSSKPASQKSGQASKQSSQRSSAPQHPTQKRSAQQRSAQQRPAQQRPTQQRPSPSQPIAAEDAEIVDLSKPISPADVGLESNDVFGLGDLSNLESPQNDPLAAEPVATARPAPQGGRPSQKIPQQRQGTAAGWQAQQQRQPKNSSGLIIALLGGGVAVLLVAVVGLVVAVLMMQDNSSEVADAGSSTNVDSVPTGDGTGLQGRDNFNDGNLNAESGFGGPSSGTNQNNVAGTFGGGNGPTTNPGGFGGGTSNPGGLGGRNTNINQNNQSQNPDGGTPSFGPGSSSGTGSFGSGDSDGSDSGDDDSSSTFGQSDSTANNEPAESSMASATATWHSQKGRKLRGAIEVPDMELVIYHYSWMCDLLPYMGHQSTFDAFNMEKPYIESPNLRPSMTIIPQFLNPLDDRERSTDIRFPNLALTHFAGMSGLEDEPNDLAADLPRSDPKAGIFGYNDVAKAEDITDGLSNTIMIVGTGRIVQPWVAGGGATIRGARPPYFGKLNGLGSTGLDDTATIVVMADGTIKHISADIDPDVFRALCTTHGAESVDMSSPLIGDPQSDWFTQ